MPDSIDNCTEAQGKSSGRAAVALRAGLPEEVEGRGNSIHLEMELNGKRLVHDWN
jgi:hypothetical protein